MQNQHIHENKNEYKKENMVKKTQPELLAPAGSREALLAAIQNGADAVYLGGKTFSARQFAANFSNEDILWAIEYAHSRGVKIHVTVNTLIADNELKEALEYLYFLAEAGVDAVILQDLGLTALLRELLPGLKMHASTQMTCHSTAGATVLRDLGFERIVMARETSLSDLAVIKRKAGVELEAFIHGALCVCFSGQCLMSSLIGGRSGNRGKCAQPCRMAYQLVDLKDNALLKQEQIGQYLLSPRDLNMSEHIRELIQAGIDSFKIEGRMKRPEYVAVVAGNYRKLIDSYYRGEDAVPDSDQHKQLEQIFNRDFTTGYFFGNPGAGLMSWKRPNNRGTRLGRVLSFDHNRHSVELLLDDRLRLGDGVEFWVTRGGRVGTTVKYIEKNGKSVQTAERGDTIVVSAEGRIYAGDRVFKTYDAALMEQARKTFTSEREADRIPLWIRAEVRAGQPLTIVLTDDLGISVQIRSRQLAETALKRPLTEDYLYKQFDRLGNTPFYIAGFKCSLDGKAIVAASEINAVRREAIEQLLCSRAQKIKAQAQLPDRGQFERLLQQQLSYTEQAVQKDEHQRCSGGYAVPELSIAVSTMQSLKAAADAGADIIYFGGESFRSQQQLTTEDIRRAAEYCLARNIQIQLSTPRVLNNAEQERFIKVADQIAGCGFCGFLAGSLGLAAQMRQRYADLPAAADFSVNAFNIASVRQLTGMGFKRVALSPEMTLQQIRELGEKTETMQLQIELECMIHGAMPLMISKYCPLGCLLGESSGGQKKNGLVRNQTLKCPQPCRNLQAGLKDRMNMVFPLEMDQDCHMHLFNSQDLCLLRELETLLNIRAVKCLRIEARNKDAGYTAAVVRSYRRAIDCYAENGWIEEKHLQVEKLEALSPAGLTKGHYFRGVL